MNKVFKIIRKDSGNYVDVSRDFGTLNAAKKGAAQAKLYPTAFVIAEYTVNKIGLTIWEKDLTLKGKPIK